MHLHNNCDRLLLWFRFLLPASTSSFSNVEKRVHLCEVRAHSKRAKETRSYWNERSPLLHLSASLLVAPLSLCWRCPKVYIWNSHTAAEKQKRPPLKETNKFKVQGLLEAWLFLSKNVFRFNATLHQNPNTYLKVPHCWKKETNLRSKGYW